jgi:membrane protein
MVLGFIDDDGLMQSGHLAYLTLLALFPFALFLMHLASSLGRSEAGAEALKAFLASLPPDVSLTLGANLETVLNQSGQGLFTLGVAVAVWTGASFIETLRDVIAKAFNQPHTRPVWWRRLQSLALVLASAALLLFGTTVLLLLPSARGLIEAYLTLPVGVGALLGWTKLVIVPIGLFTGLYGIYFTLTPKVVRPCPYWPGAVLSLATWTAAASLLPVFLAQMATYDATYGGLAGVMIALLFFYIVGIGFVAGAQLNAAIKATAALPPAAKH